MARKFRSPRVKTKRKKVHVRRADGTCARHPGEPMFRSRVSSGASTGCRLCKKDRTKPLDSVYYLRKAQRKLINACASLNRMRGWPNDGRSDAWLTMYMRLYLVEGALWKKERELNIGPELIFGRSRGYGIRPKPRICDRIQREKLRPKLNAAGLWDGVTAIRPDGTDVRLTDQVAAQIGVMARRGAWPDLYAPEKRERKYARRNLRESQHGE